MQHEDDGFLNRYLFVLFCFVLFFFHKLSPLFFSLKCLYMKIGGDAFYIYI